MKVKILKDIFENMAGKSVTVYDETYIKVAEIENLEGEPEIHKAYTDVYIVIEGKGNLYTGKKLKTAVEISAGEFRGKEIEDAEQHELYKDSIVVIPPGIAHKLDVKEKMKLVVLKLKA
ncbi:MAG: hypothetical protein DRP32_08710 [Thermotogae bacterium]|uniref:YhcH/YjgK/YiaL family protein n=1 Tax=Kosmotoga sp. TaxID=1955248 RepID=UPI000F1C646A|nr:YhcH/YjgK/YiaL family protein [Kosmotoga sp.]MBO8167460.1 YhcH/YjgK/YiaL family protein [Kosmotoga sp.]RKX47586.1 MAG: hypothetical protein DRP32_08710 [Thermotogota bacterium]